MATESRSNRRWYTDAATGFAFLLLSFYLTRGAKSLFGGMVALFVFAITAGTAFAFSRSAWREIQRGRSRAKLR